MNLHGSEQEQDLSDAANCGGYGRVRHFRRYASIEWPPDPLPIDPACKALGLQRVDLLRAQVFQLAACNWRCWYCFVPHQLLSADVQHAGWLTAEELIDAYGREPDRPATIDLTGGHPGLAPEWVPWVMRALLAQGLAESTFLWSDDNLSNDYYWRYLLEEDRNFVASYKNYGRVGCFKGFDQESFCFNTGADAGAFDRQFELMGRYLGSGIDIYGYVTLTSPTLPDIAGRVSAFVDRLQGVHELLPLRTVPLEVKVYTPVWSRLDRIREASLTIQYAAIESWMCEIERRFGSTQHVSIADVSLV